MISAADSSEDAEQEGGGPQEGYERDCVRERRDDHAGAEGRVLSQRLQRQRHGRPEQARDRECHDHRWHGIGGCTRLHLPSS